MPRAQSGKRKLRPKPAEDRAEAGTGAVRDAALKLLTRREHSSRELTRKLIQRGYDEATITSVVEALTAERWLSDERFVEGYVGSRMARGYGPLRIQAELQQHGIDEALIARHLDFEDPAWAEQVGHAYHKRFGGEPPLDSKDRARRLRFLQGRGFTTAQIRKVLD